MIGILVPCNAKIYLIKWMWVSDLHFMVHCICHILKTFDGQMSYLGYWFHVMQRFISLNEPFHEIMVLFVLCNRIRQTRMRSHPIGPSLVAYMIS